MEKKRHTIKLEDFPEPQIKTSYKCPTCGCALSSMHEYLGHYGEHIRTGLPFVASITLPPLEEDEE